MFLSPYCWEFLEVYQFVGFEQLFGNDFDGAFFFPPSKLELSVVRSE